MAGLTSPRPGLGSSFTLESSKNPRLRGLLPSSKGQLLVNRLRVQVNVNRVTQKQSVAVVESPFCKYASPLGSMN
jgi:hypothetical protein